MSSILTRRLPWLLLALAVVALASAAALRQLTPAATEAAPAPRLRIGLLVSLSGPGRQWGEVNRWCAEVTAARVNAEGGLPLGNGRVPIELVIQDTAGDPQTAVAGAERLIQRGVRYIIGPNIDDTCLAVRPVLEAAGAIHIAYGFTTALYRAPQQTSLLGMAASYQVAPILFSHLRDRLGVRSVAFVPRLDTNAVAQRNSGQTAARRAGLEVRDLEVVDLRSACYRSAGSAGPLLRRILALRPDALILTGLQPAEAPVLLRALRVAGFGGPIAALNAHEPETLARAGAHAEGFIFPGGSLSTTHDSASMTDFRRRYEAHVGRWHDEAGTKVYALELILQTLSRAGPAALRDTTVFRHALERLDLADPFCRSPRKLRLVGRETFGARRQIDVPVVLRRLSGGRVIQLALAALPE